MSSSTLNEAVLSRPGCPVDLAAAWAVVATPGPCHHDLRLVALEVDIVEDLRASTVAAAAVGSVAVSEVAAVGSDEMALADEMIGMATVHPAARLPVLASTVETGIANSPVVVGMTATADAHLTTDATTDVTSVAVVVMVAADSGTATIDAAEATWNPSVAAARAVGVTAIVTAIATTTDLLGTTAASEDTRVAATMNHARSAATNSGTHIFAATKLCYLDIWWVVRSLSS